MSIGKITDFKLGEANWTTYIARFEQYFIANKIENDLKVNTLLAVVGEETFELMVDLCNPRTPENQTYDYLVTLMKDHLQPEPSKRAERFKLRQRKQEPNETFASYLAALKKLAKTCQFGDQLEDHLTDQFLYGIRNENIRQQLFAEKELEFSKAVRVALSMEAAEKNSHMIEEASTSTAIHKVSTRKPPEVTRNSRGRCRHCGKTNHDEYHCFFKNARCHLCSVVGHIRSVCKVGAKGSKKFVQTHNIQLNSNDDKSTYIHHKIFLKLSSL